MVKTLEDFLLKNVFSFVSFKSDLKSGCTTIGLLSLQILDKFLPFSKSGIFEDMFRNEALRLLSTSKTRFCGKLVLFGAIFF